MKLKLKLDKNTIQEFLLQNVEKMVLSVVVLIFLMMLYSSLSSAGHFEKTPQQLQDEVARGRRDIEATTFDGYIKEKQASAPSDPNDPTAPSTGSLLVVKDYTSQAKRSRVEIEETPYVTPIALDPPLFARRPLRDIPPLFTVQKLRGSGAIGAFRTTSAAQPERMGMPVATTARGGQIRALRWIVVTGLVPFEKQELAYDETFKQSRGYDPENDYPSYLGYWVQRVEVTDSGDVAPDWENAETFISSKMFRAATQGWSDSKDVEIVPSEFLEERLVFPLGPLVNREWDVNVAHEPEIPIIRDARGGQGGFNMRGPAGMQRGGNSRRRGRDGPMGGPMGGRMGGGRRNELGVEDTPFGRGESEEDESQFDENRVADNELPRGDRSYKLFRFFDFNVEPGKRYIYRVCLALRNPNHGVKEALLNNPELAKDTYLKTKWSEPSPTFAAPRDTQVLLASVNPGRGNGDPTAEILMTTWIHEKGIEVFKESTVTRGQMANYSKEDGRLVGSGNEPTPKKPEIKREKKPAPARGPGGRGLEGLGRGPGGFGGREMGAMGRIPQAMAPGNSDTFKADFNSEATAIDFRGGKRLSGRRGNAVTAPGEMLLLDADGFLIVRNELDDASTRKQVTTARQNMNRPGGMPAPGGLSPFGLEGLEMRRPPGRM